MISRLPLLLLVGLLPLAASATARADGAMSVGARELFREGAAERSYCRPGALTDECDHVKTKVLSGYGTSGATSPSAP